MDFEFVLRCVCRNQTCVSGNMVCNRYVPMRAPSFPAKDDIPTSVPRNSEGKASAAIT